MWGRAEKEQMLELDISELCQKTKNTSFTMKRLTQTLRLLDFILEQKMLKTLAINIVALSPKRIYKEKGLALMMVYWFILTI